jgi:transcriptional regulator with XRE-family HTH domain
VIIIFIDKKEIGQRIKQIRSSLSQKDFADKLNVAQSYIGQIEVGKTKPSLELLISICDNYDVSLDWILIGKEKESETKVISYEDAQLEKIISSIYGFYKEVNAETWTWFYIQFWSVLPNTLPIFNEWLQKKHLKKHTKIKDENAVIEAFPEIAEETKKEDAESGGTNTNSNK